MRAGPSRRNEDVPLESNMNLAPLCCLLVSSLAPQPGSATAIESVESVGVRSIEPYVPAQGEAVPGQPYRRFTTRDRLGREVTFYLTESTGPDPLPLIAFVHGSGCASVFREHQGRVYGNGGHSVLFDVARGRAHVLIVEKPGVTYLDPPSNCEGAQRFHEEHTLERWAEAVEAAIRAARELPQVSSERALVIGHSEGGLVACRVARDLPGIVTEVASIAGGGPTQLFDLVTLAREGEFFRELSDAPEVRVEFVLDGWRAARDDPDAADRFFFGFAHRRWTTFLATSPLRELRNVDARIYVAQGGADRAVDPASGDALYAQLFVDGKDVTYDRPERADHSFRDEARPDADGWLELHARIADWFLDA